MSLPINLIDFDTFITTYLSDKIPATDVSDFYKLNRQLISSYVSEFDEAIMMYNKFCHDPQFPYRQFLKNSLQLSQKFRQDLPRFSLAPINELTYKFISESSYFKIIWQVRPVELLTINLLQLLYRTAVLLQHQDILMEGNRQLVQISSTVEEMVYLLHLQGRTPHLYNAFQIWYADWEDEGFDQRLIKLNVS